MLGLFILLSIALIAIVVVLTTLIVREAQRPPRHTAGYAVAKGLPCDPGELGYDFEAWSLDRGDGVTLPVWELHLHERPETTPSQDEAESPTTVIFIHGWGHSKIDMLSRIELWKEMADCLVFYDLRGHGEAEGSLSRLGHREEEDLLALVERLGDRRFLLVGHSMGAVIAIQAAARKDDAVGRIKGIVAYGAYADFHATLKGRLRRVSFPASPLSDLAMAWFRMKGIRHRHLIHEVEQLACPLLVVHGTQDDIAPLAGAQNIVDGAADGALHQVDEAGHRDAHCIDSESHDQVVREFVLNVT